MLRVVRLEGDTEQRGDWAESDIAPLPVQAQAEYFFAFPFTAADDTAVIHGASVGARIGTGQGKAGNVGTIGQARQVMIALFIRAVMHQQLSRAEGVGHHDGRRKVATAGGQFHHDLRVGVGREALATVFLGDDQGEESFGLDVIPRFLWKVHALANFPVVDHGA